MQVIVQLRFQCVGHAPGLRGRLPPRLTTAFRKKWENHEAALALFFVFYNFCRLHMTLTEEASRKTTPAVAAGLADHVWTVVELLRNVQIVA